MKLKNSGRSLEAREAELSKYVSSLMGYDYYPGVTSEVLLMPDEEAREHMRTQVLMSLSARLFNFLTTTNEDVKRLVLETNKGETRLVISNGTGSEDMEQSKELEKDDENRSNPTDEAQ